MGEGIAVYDVGGFPSQKNFMLKDRFLDLHFGTVFSSPIVKYLLF